jgi:hypothetical protein
MALMSAIPFAAEDSASVTVAMAFFIARRVWRNPAGEVQRAVEK